MSSAIFNRNIGTNPYRSGVLIGNYVEDLIKSNNVEEFYQELKKEEADEGYIEQVINWAKLYTGKGKALYEIYKEEQEKNMKVSKKNTYILSFPNITE